MSESFIETPSHMTLIKKDMLTDMSQRFNLLPSVISHSQKIELYWTCFGNITSLVRHPPNKGWMFFFIMIVDNSTWIKDLHVSSFILICLLFHSWQLYILYLFIAKKKKNWYGVVDNNTQCLSMLIKFIILYSITHAFYLLESLRNVSVFKQKQIKSRS